jgi:hypothetical protein
MRVSIEEGIRRIGCGKQHRLPLLPINYKETTLQAMNRSMQTPSISTKEGYVGDDASSQLSQGNDTLGPTESSGNASGSKSEGKQPEDGTEELAKHVKAILEAAWENSSPTFREGSQVFKARRPNEDSAESRVSLRWRFDSAKEDSELRSVLSGLSFPLAIMGRVEVEQIKELIGLMPPMVGNRCEADLGQYRMTFAECEMGLTKCTVHQRKEWYLVTVDFGML